MKNLPGSTWFTSLDMRVRIAIVAGAGLLLLLVAYHLTSKSETVAARSDVSHQAQSSFKATQLAPTQTTAAPSSLVSNTTSGGHTNTTPQDPNTSAGRLEAQLNAASPPPAAHENAAIPQPSQAVKASGAVLENTMGNLLQCIKQVDQPGVDPTKHNPRDCIAKYVAANIDVDIPQNGTSTRLLTQASDGTWVYIVHDPTGKQPDCHGDTTDYDPKTNKFGAHAGGDCSAW